MVRVVPTVVAELIVGAGVAAIVGAGVAAIVGAGVGAAVSGAMVAITGAAVMGAIVELSMTGTQPHGVASAWTAGQKTGSMKPSCPED